jgi:hypothetical protein
MINLNFKHWLEATTPRGIPNKQYQVKDLRTAPYGPYSGFRDTPGLATRLGSDFFGGMQSYYANTQNQVTSQEARPTYDLSRDFKIDASGRLASVQIPYSKKIIYKLDKDGNYLDESGNPTSDIEKAVYDDPKSITSKANEIMKKHITTNRDMLKELLDKDAEIDSLTYVDADDIGKNEKGEDMVMLKYAARIYHGDERTSNRLGTSSPNHKWNVILKSGT